MASSINKCRCCLTTKEPLIDRTIDEQTGEESLYVRKMKDLFAELEFNMTVPFMICVACGQSIENILRFKQEICKRGLIIKRNTSKATLNCICRCCLSMESIIKLEPELIESFRLYLHDLFDKNDYLGIENHFKLCVKCCNMLENFHRIKENVFHANAVFENVAISEDNIKCELETAIDIKEEYVENNNELNDNSTNDRQTEKCTANGRGTKHKGKTRKRKHECEQCNKRFVFSSDLQRHSASHLGEKNYECEHCRKRFSSSRNCKMHSRIHTHEKVHECQHCKRRFLYLSDLKRHLLIHVKGKVEKKFVCNYCNKGFIQSGDLKRHLLSHSGERNYRCEYCDKSYILAKHLKRHLLKCLLKKF